jgi:hypothetical protein
MILTTVFFVSFSTLAFEVLLTRVFSIGQWNHLSFMVISIAMFGFGASGTFLSLTDIRKDVGRIDLASKGSLAIIVCLYTACTILSFLAVNRMPLDYFRLPVEPAQSFYLLAAFLLLSLPFFFSGLVVAVAYTFLPEKSGYVYFMSMAGSAGGAFFPVPLLPLLAEERLLIISAVIALVPVLLTSFAFFKGREPDKSGKRRMQIALVTSGTALFFSGGLLFTSRGMHAIEVKSSPYKALSQILQFPKSRIVETSTGLRGRIHRVKTPFIRFAPGLSLKYMEALPQQEAIFRDGDNLLVTYELKEKTDALFAQYMLSYAGYTLVQHPDDVLLIEYDGGSAIACALASGARHISILEAHPHVAEILSRHYPFAVINQNPRAFLAQSRDRFDIIHLENWGTSIPGTAALNQEHSLTEEAFTEYLNHLTAGGVVILSRRLLLPPSDSLRLWSAAYQALKRTGIENPGQHLAILRNWDTFTLLVSQSAIDAQIISDFAGRRNFDLVFLDGITPDMVNRFNVFDKPYHFQTITQLSAAYQTGAESDFFRSYFLDVSPQSDDRPFPSRFLKWPKIKLLYESLGSRRYTLMLSSEFVVAVVFLEALAVTIVLLFIPLVLSTQKRQKPTFSQILYFFCIGAGFMFVELYFIQRYILLAEDPVISFTLVVPGILIFSSLGGLWAQNGRRRHARFLLLALIVVLILTVAGFALLTPAIMRASSGLRCFIALLFLFPSGFLMGLPFPLGMQFWLHSPVQRAYAWSVNGCASVLTSILSTQIAISYGIPVIMICAAFSYGVALLCRLRDQ